MRDSLIDRENPWLRAFECGGLGGPFLGCRARGRWLRSGGAGGVWRGYWGGGGGGGAVGKCAAVFRVNLIVRRARESSACSCDFECRRENPGTAECRHGEGR
jgi:hypothetical protein